MPRRFPRYQIVPGRAISAGLILIIVATVGLTQSPGPGLTQVSPRAVVPILPESVAAPSEVISRVGAAGDMIGFSHSDGAGTQTITLVHTEKSWMAVYHVDRSGKIRLVSSRPIDADFSLQLNATAPLPEEIREIGRR